MPSKFLSVVIAVAGLVVAHGAVADPSITHIEVNGTLVFAEIADAMGYRVEWASTADGPWTNFTGHHGQWLDDIPATGDGVITATVPMFYRVVALMPPSNMVYIPAGTFMMGNATNVLPVEEGFPNELPQHEVFTDAFYIDKYEVTCTLWGHILSYAMSHWGYYFASGNYDCFVEGQPQQGIFWFDAVKWCNARSEYEGLTPVYYTDSAFTNIYRSGEVVPYVNWLADGYRLPTEAEWEKAARGGKPDLRYPWSDTGNEFSPIKLNYEGDPYFTPTSPVGSFPPNDYGLFDMAGNVMEWVWDWYDENYYSISPTHNPRGLDAGMFRVARGGSYSSMEEEVRISTRHWMFPSHHDSSFYGDFGFRCVRRP
ncbi:MAG TPA: SUMF1/EgtB/PvdO family nonheme iron enzyme [Kiritimatiellia bacterium]|nr:SUMF1/EgtB/PvdO family nonheme iron enzyme [Kiritimatiellia bacterium]